MENLRIRHLPIYYVLLFYSSTIRNPKGNKMNNEDLYLVRKLIKRVFGSFTQIDKSFHDPEAKRLLNLVEDSFVEMIPKMLSEKEKFHYMESVKHSLFFSDARYNEINNKLIERTVEIIENAL
jgi:hypothetical protein